MKKKFIKLLLFALLLSSTYMGVYAHSSSDGNNSNYGSCSNDLDWCYSNIGIRFSLYKYKTGTLMYYNAIDYGTNYDSLYGRKPLNGRTARVVPASSGKVAYLNGKSTLRWSSEYYKLEVKTGSGFPCYFGTNCPNFTSSNGLKNKILEEFAINIANPNANTVLSKINSFFGTDIMMTDLNYVYITIEPTIYIYNRSGESYFGTIYELMNLSNAKSGSSYYGLNEVLYYTFPVSMFAANPTAVDSNNFVSRNSSAKVRVLSNYRGNLKTGYDSYTTNRKYNRDNIVKNYGYGIGVFWVGDYVNATCRSTCTTLNCAEKYCEENESNNKESCINTCGFADPGKSSCSDSCSTPSTSSCSSEVESTKTTCSWDKYVLTKCKQKTNLKYSNDLPKVLSTGVDGFDYSVKLTGYRKCTLTFDKAKYEYDYAILKSGDSKRTTMSLYLNDYNNKSDSNYYNYKLNGTIKMTVDGKNYNFVRDEDKTELTTARVSKSAKRIIVNEYDSNSDKSTSVSNDITYNSNYTSLYQLPKQCYSIRQGSIYIPTLSNPCKIVTGDILSHAFYSTDDTPGRKNVTIESNFPDSCLSDKNTCYYVNGNPDKAARCWITYEKVDDTEYNVTFNLENRNALQVKYNFDGTTGTANTSLSQTKVITKLAGASPEIKGSIEYSYNGQKIITTCPATLPPSGSTGPNCPEEIGGKNAKYEAIQSYCAINWKDDVNNYSSEKDCVDSCGGPITKSCKQFNLSKEADIRGWCEINYKDAGYKSVEACYNDCLTSNDNKEYIYRPISLGKTSEDILPGEIGFNAFPNRKAGSNWIGYEDEYTAGTDVLDEDKKQPIYVIKLDKDKIKKVKEDTKTKGKSVYLYNESDEYPESTKYYRSEFIKNNKGSDGIFTKVCEKSGGCK